MTPGTTSAVLKSESPTDLLLTLTCSSWARGCRGTDSRSTCEGRDMSKARAPTGRKQPYPSLQNVAFFLTRKQYNGIGAKNPNWPKKSNGIPAEPGASPLIAFHGLTQRSTLSQRNTLQLGEPGANWFDKDSTCSQVLCFTV